MLSAGGIAAKKLVFVFYVCGCGLGTSLADCSGSRVHKIQHLLVRAQVVVVLTATLF